MISKVMEFYSISLTVYKTVTTTVYVPRDLTLNGMIILPEHPVYIHVSFDSYNMHCVFLYTALQNLVCVIEMERLFRVGNRFQNIVRNSGSEVLRQ
jgi:hypothetical protein